MITEKRSARMESQKEAGNCDSDEDYKLYPTRWLMLFLFVLCGSGSLMQWVEYSIISDVLVKYYGVTYEAANWTCLIYLLLYIPFVFLGNYVFSKFGLRLVVILGALGTCIGAWIKVASVAPDRFWIVLFGQSMVGIAQIFILPTSTPLAAEWFGSNEVSSACSIGVAGYQFGLAIGFIFPPLLVTSQTSLEDIEDGLFVMALTVASVCSVSLLLIVIFFKDKPPTPPSKARLQAMQSESKTSYVQSIKVLLKNRSYVTLLLVYGIDTGTSYAFSVLLNEIILWHYPEGSKDAGRIGLLIIMSGAVASVFYGIILDKFKIYKGAILGTQCICCIAMILFTFLLNQGLLLVYLTALLLGTFLTSLMPIAFEFAAELTYPEPEGITSGLLNAAAQVFGIAFTYLYSFLFYKFGDIWSNSFLSVIFLVGFIVSIFSEFELKRQAVNIKSNTNKGVVNTAFDTSS